MTLTQMLAGSIGVALILIIVWDAFETILVPRRIGRRVRLTRYFFMTTWRVWRAVARRIRQPSRREGLLGIYGPLSLILLLSCWAAGLILAFALLALATGGHTTSMHGQFVTLVYMSGETFFTLGFGDITPTTGLGRMLAVLEAGLGFGFLATVIGYLPTMYGAFAQREVEISLMDARAGSPPTATEFLRRASSASDADLCDTLLASWERWSAQLLETHISYPQLAYYRSQHGNQSWVASLTVILDTTSLLLTQSGSRSTTQAQLTFAMARHALVDITQIFVRRHSSSASERLTRESLALLRAQLAETSLELSSTGEFEVRLHQLRLQYEPYAQALAAYLLFELPPWVHAQPRRDNWRRGPWDRLLPAHHEPSRGSHEHF
jgi:hypothetical protein